jgi:hypothetical protein
MYCGGKGVMTDMHRRRRDGHTSSYEVPIKSSFAHQKINMIFRRTLRGD